MLAGGEIFIKYYTEVTSRFSRVSFDTEKINWKYREVFAPLSFVPNKLIIDVIGVIKMSMQSFTRLVGIGSKSEDLHGARRTRWRTSSAVTQLRFC